MFSSLPDIFYGNRATVLRLLGLISTHFNAPAAVQEARRSRIIRRYSITDMTNPNNPNASAKPPRPARAFEYHSAPPPRPKQGPPSKPLPTPNPNLSMHLGSPPPVPRRPSAEEMSDKVPVDLDLFIANLESDLVEQLQDSNVKCSQWHWDSLATEEHEDKTPVSPAQPQEEYQAIETFLDDLIQGLDIKVATV